MCICACVCASAFACVFSYYVHNIHTAGSICILKSKEVLCPSTDCTTAISIFRMHTLWRCFSSLMVDGHFLIPKLYIKRWTWTPWLATVQITWKRCYFTPVSFYPALKNSRYLLWWATKSVAYLSNFRTDIYCVEVQIPLQLWSEQEKGT